MDKDIQAGEVLAVPSKCAVKSTQFVMDGPLPPPNIWTTSAKVLPVILLTIQKNKVRTEKRKTAAMATKVSIPSGKVPKNSRKESITTQ